jgi:hypothetical protein
MLLDLLFGKKWLEINSKLIEYYMIPCFFRERIVKLLKTLSKL